MDVDKESDGNEDEETKVAERPRKKRKLVSWLSVDPSFLFCI